MARKPNYRFERLERQRAKAAKKAARLEANREKVAKRKAEHAGLELDEDGNVISPEETAENPAGEPAGEPLNWPQKDGDPSR
jgi:hypothetical protein